MSPMSDVLLARLIKLLMRCIPQANLLIRELKSCFDHVMNNDAGLFFLCLSEKYDEPMSLTFSTSLSSR